jgi:hypothetical protein
VSYYVQYYRDGKWCETYSPVLPGPSRTEAERLAAKRSMNGLVYRVRKGKQTVSKFQLGNQLTKEDSE